jgi:hypothetical protein
MDHVAMEPTELARQWTRFAAGRLLIFGLACLAGWAVAYGIHMAVIWWRTPSTGEVAGLGAAFQHVADSIRHALYR